MDVSGDTLVEKAKHLPIQTIVIIFLLLIGPMLQYVTFTTHMGDYEAITTERITSIISDVGDMQKELVALQVEMAEHRTSVDHLNDHIDRLEKKIDQLLNRRIQ